MRIRRIAIWMMILLSLAFSSFAQEVDPLDPFAFRSDSQSLDTEDPDKLKSADDLLREAILLQQEDHLLDSRTKLLKALKKAPKDFRIHIALADYYTRHVGHFRLALKYAKQAERLFIARMGEPPYPAGARNELFHGDILMLVSQARLNLDDYQGALDKLEEFEEYGYASSRLAASKAWILMKLGRLEEAINVSRQGLLAGANPGHTLNILGILLSMSGERESSLEIFKEALRYEMSLGSYGNPSTPLNNSGEVYKEIFNETLAKKSWIRALQLPDGCEHVLPSLNLALMYIDELEVPEAKKAIDNFESCFAQFPLRNGEEHRALVHLARGRIALHTGHIDDAIKHFEAAQQRQQWFGKIGTNIEDLQVGIQASLAMALRVKNNHLRFQYYDSSLQSLAAFKDRIINSIRAVWLERKARKTLAIDLESMEDLYIRHTDSMIEYPSFGSLLATFPLNVLTTRLGDFISSDNRKPAQRYYRAYLIEAKLKNGNYSEGLRQLDELLPSLRIREDALLKTHLLSLKLHSYSSPEQRGYVRTAYEILQLNAPSLRNAGGFLPVNFTRLPQNVRYTLEETNLHLTNGVKLPLQVQYEHKKSLHTLTLVSELQTFGTITVKASNIGEATNKFLATIFSKNIL